jgi:hypothetical protein
MLKNVHKFFNKADLLWLHLIRTQYYSNGKRAHKCIKRFIMVEKYSQIA